MLPAPAPKRQRGRPQGTGKDDSAILSRVADRLLAEPKLTPTTAMKQTLDMTKPGAASDVRRLQNKWKADFSKLLEAAVQRVEERERRTQAAHESRQEMLARISRIIADPKMPDRLAQSMGFLNLQHAQNSATAAVEAFQRHVKALEASGFLRFLDELRKSPIAEAMRRMEETQRAVASPTTLKMIADIEARQRQIAGPSQKIGDRLVHWGAPFEK